MDVRRVEKSEVWPLPADYEELTRDGRRQARVAACQQWRLRGPVKDRAEAFVAGVRFFDQWYLRPDWESGFDPMFYDDEPLPDALFHYDILRHWASSRASIAIAPRGSAKSYLVRKANMLRMVSHPMYSIIYATSTGDNAKVTGQSLKDQFHNNRRLVDDWAPEFPSGRMVPKRGEATFGTLHMQLQNGSWFRAISAESRMRGGRPRRFVLDDPEFDPKASTSMQLIRDYMEVLLFKVVLPMVMRPGCGADWMATFVSKRHYAWHAMSTERQGDGSVVAKDPRFNLWSRMIVRAEYEDPETKEVRSCWPEMWPATRERKLANPEWKDRVSLEEIRESIGTANYLSEYMGRPGEGDDVFFPSLREDRHGYSITGGDGWLEEGQAWKSEAKIRWWSVKDEEWQEMTLARFWESYRSRFFMTVDTSYTAGPDSDYKVACLMAMDHNLDLFVLDLWSAQCQETELIKRAFRMADKWRCPVIWPEIVREGISVYNGLLSVVRQRAQEDLTGVTHLPGIKKLNPGRTEKAAKIASLLLRFEHGKIKFPLADRRPPFRRLFNQVAEFNPEAPDGGLQHDDELDCLVDVSVVTTRGYVPLSTVVVGDRVMTRGGWKSVVAAHERGEREVIERFGVAGTPDHHIFTVNRGWVSLDCLAGGDTLAVWVTERPWLWTGSGSTGTRSRRGDTFGSTTGATGGTVSHPKACTVTCGGEQGGSFLRDTWSTTPTRTRSTTISPTCGASRRASTEGSIGTPIGPRSPRPGTLPTSPRYDRRLPSGTVLLRDEPGTGSMLVGVPAQSLCEGSSASSAVRRIRRFLMGGTSSVRTPVVDGEQRPTYDLSVEGCHEFVAGGVLVHNCVAMSQYVLRGRAARPFRGSVSEKGPMDRLLNGEIYDEAGLPLGLRVDWDQVGVEEVQELMRLRTEGSHGGTKV